MQIRGIWYPAGSSERHKATLLLDRNRYLLQIDDVNQNDPPCSEAEAAPSAGFVSALETSQRVGNIPRKITFNNHSIFETQDNDKIDRWIELSRTRLGLGAALHKIESKWHWIIASLAIVIFISFASFNWGLPWSSKVLARAMPDSVVEKVSSHTMSALDKLLFEPSDLSATRQEQLKTHFYTLTRLHGLQKNQVAKFNIHFRKLGSANAFALPSGDIVISDELLAVTENQNQVDAVLLHEVGHVVHNHGLQQVIRASMVSFIVALIAGNPSGLEEVFVALPTFMLNSHYSREHEVEADLFALTAMSEKGIDPLHFAEALEKIDPNLTKEEQEDAGQSEKLKPASPKDESVLDYFSSHPATSARIATVLEYSKRFQQQHKASEK